MPVPDFILAIREKIGHDLLWLPGVTAVVLDDAERVLLVRRADNGAWTPVTGIPEPSEEPAVAAVREVLEETGVVAVADRLAKTGASGPIEHVNGDRAAYLDLTFACRYVSGDPHVGDDESTQVRWFGLGELPPMDPDFVARIEAAVQGGPAAIFEH